jgi:hypothetical protein
MSSYNLRSICVIIITYSCTPHMNVDHLTKHFGYKMIPNDVNGAISKYHNWNMTIAFKLIYQGEHWLVSYELHNGYTL